MTSRPPSLLGHPDAERVFGLAAPRGLSTADAERLMKRDEDEPLPQGQQARDSQQPARRHHGIWARGSRETGHLRE
jgi:hypothetical protein